jgi:hypothetical protein
MATLPEIRSKETKMASLRSYDIKPYKELPASSSFNTQLPVIINPIDPKRLSKEPIKSLTKSSMVKAGLVFFGTLGVYYLTKTTNILSYFGWGAKNSDSKNIGSSEIAKVKNGENALTVRRTPKTIGQTNNLSVNQIVKTYKDKDRSVEFEEIEVKKFENFQKIEKQENLRMQKSFSRRSINIQNPIPNQNAIIGLPFNLTIDGPHVFSSSSSFFLEATNIPVWLMLTPLNPNPTFKGSCDTLGSFDGVAVSGNYAYVADDWGDLSSLQIIDISSPSNPTFKGGYHGLDGVEGIAVSSNYVYVADGRGGLKIIDITNSANPTLKGSYGTSRAAHGVAVSGNYAYVANDSAGLQIIDISDPSNPTFKGSCYMPGDAWGIAVSGNYAYVGAHGSRYSSGLCIIDISDPSNPTFKSSYYTFYPLFRIAVSGNYAYVAELDCSKSLKIIDISNPVNPTFKGSCDMPGCAYEESVFGNYAYVAADGSGLQIIDISDPSNPTFKGSYDDTPGYAKGVALFGNYAYVADGSSGLQIIALNPDEIILSGTPMFEGTYSIDIKACNEIMECITDSFDIIVEVDDTTDTTNLTNSIVIISSMTVVACAACIASFCIPLSIVGGIVMLRRSRNKILRNENNTGAKELKEVKELKKSETSDDKKNIVKEKLFQPIEE